jgi:hypothetical protein
MINGHPDGINNALCDTGLSDMKKAVPFFLTLAWRGRVGA